MNRLLSFHQNFNARIRFTSTGNLTSGNRIILICKSIRSASVLNLKKIVGDGFENTENK